MNKLKLTKNILTGTLLILIGIIIGMLISNHIQNVKANIKPTTVIQQEQNNQPVKLTKVLTQSTENIKLDKNEVYRELSDNSYSLENNSTKEYTFTPSIMGDWDLKADSKEELDNMISTYIENTNNLLNKTIKKPLKITKVLTESTDEVRISENEIYTEYSTNAWTIEDNKNNKYELSIPELGDYTYVFNNRKDFDNCLQTYIDNYNNSENLSI